MKSFSKHGWQIAVHGCLFGSWTCPLAGHGCAERGEGAGSSGDIPQITPILLLNRHGICDFPCSLDTPPLISPRDTSLWLLIWRRGVSNDGLTRACRARLGQANTLIRRARHAAASLDSALFACYSNGRQASRRAFLFAHTRPGSRNARQIAPAVRVSSCQILRPPRDA